MRFDIQKVIAGAALLAAGVGAQNTVTTTLPWANGDTIAIVVSTNALGVPVTSTVATLTGGAAGGVTTGLLTTARTTPLTLPTTTTRRLTTALTTPLTTQRVVGQETTAPPMKTTTYGYDPGNGVWTSAVWTASVTAPPDVATAVVPAGTIQDYNSYQTVVNSHVLSSAQAAEASAALVASKSAASERMSGVRGVAGWGLMGAGLVLGGLLM